MEELHFKPSSPPFDYWFGPYSVRKGKSGYTIRGSIGNGGLYTQVQDDNWQETWKVLSTGVHELVELVQKEFNGGGGISILPNGFVIKPLQDEHDVGWRQIIGRIYGTVVLGRGDASLFGFDSLSELEPGDAWEGPKTTGLVCTIRNNGSLDCKWLRKTQFGEEKVSEKLRVSDPELRAGFRKARPNDSGGRVRVQASGHVITNREVGYRKWSTFYVGHIDPNTWKCDWNSEDWVKSSRAG